MLLLRAWVLSSGRQPGGMMGRVPAQARCPGLSAAPAPTPRPSSWSISASLCRYIHTRDGRQVPGLAQRSCTAVPPAAVLRCSRTSSLVNHQLSRGGGDQASLGSIHLPSLRDTLFPHFHCHQRRTYVCLIQKAFPNSFSVYHALGKHHGNHVASF